MLARGSGPAVVLRAAPSAAPAVSILSRRLLLLCLEKVFLPFDARVWALALHHGAVRRSRSDVKSGPGVKLRDASISAWDAEVDFEDYRVVTRPGTRL